VSILSFPLHARAEYLVLGSFGARQSALKSASELESRLGLELALADVQVKGRLLFRIVSGPHEKQRAIALQKEVAAQGVIGAWLLQEKTDVLSADISPVTLTAPPGAPPAALLIAQPIADESPPAEQLIVEPEVGPEETNALLETESEVYSAGTERSVITLKQAVQIALSQNLGLLASEQGLKSGEALVRQSKSGLLPQFTSGLLQTAIDEDRAEAGFGRAPEYRTSASLKLTQVIYSDDVKATYDIQRVLQSARVSEQRSTILDTILRASTGYLTLLRAETLARIFADDLKLTDSNYERAKVRLELGVANKAEVYRWETAQAKSRTDLVVAEMNVERARIELNRVLNMPLDKAFNTKVPKVTDTYLLIADPVVWERLKNDSHRDEIREFWLSEALLNSPELATLREKIAAQERALLAARRSITIPTIALAVEGTKHLSEKGSGTDQLDVEIPGSEIKFGGSTDNVEWSAGLNATLPLYAGGERYARIAREQADLAQLKLAYDAALLKIQAKVLQDASSVQASLKNIDYSQDATKASRNNLQLVTDSYERGVVTNIELLEAKFALLSSELSAANTVYDFIIEYLNLQRSTGNFDLASTAEELSKTRDRMDNYFN
jgi:outer membrane protein TolC